LQRYKKTETFYFSLFTSFFLGRAPSGRAFRYTPRFTTPSELSLLLAHTCPAQQCRLWGAATIPHARQLGRAKQKTKSLCFFYKSGYSVIEIR